AALGNAGSTVVYTEPLLPSRSPNLRDCVDAVAKGDVDTLLIVGTNPAYSAPADLDVARMLADELKKPAAKRKSKKEWLAVYMGLYHDETARLCHWHVPQAHFLEQWSDAVAFDGTASVVQPLIAPLYEGKSAHELLAALTHRESDFDDRSPLDLVRERWNSLDDAAWAKALHDGVIAGSAAKPVTAAVAADLFTKPDMKPVAPSGKGYDLAFAVEPGVFDGQFANNGWLQEWPRPLTRLTWDNALMISPATAEMLGVGTKFRTWKSGGEHGEQVADVVLVKHGKYTLEAAIWVVPGHADEAVTLHLGYGRERAGKVGTKLGFNAYKLRTSDASWFASGVEISKTVRTFSLACIQGHTSMEGRDLVRSGTVAEYAKDPKFATAHDHHVGFEEKDGRKVPLTLYPKEHHYTGYKWGMAIDLSACTGCGSCVVACQSENNSPVIGKEEVTRGRHMQWLRIDRYFSTGKEQPHSPPAVHFQPVMCQHCEQAPCELVCPVEATVHGDEGTNDMVYNRCVGTRYCANNCPYKVRRFNFLSYADYDTPSLKLLHNPDVTVRSRGVIEKCTFCIQRISYARIEAAKEAMDELDLPPEKQTRRDANGPDGGPRRHDGKEVPLIRDGEVLSACQSACPADAIVFGDLNDKKSRVHAMHGSTLNYSLLGELGTRPRVAYLAELRNPNPALEAK
ncbi:MAG: 4Fe-4S dicluster domain-containing protein, partial [Gemmataceae bacterium]